MARIVPDGQTVTITVEPDYPKLEAALDRLRRTAFIEEGGVYNDIVDLDDVVKYMFASGDLSVINFKGENYYRACGELVTGKWGDVSSTCVKRINHPGNVHEDYDGNTKGSDETPNNLDAPSDDVAGEAPTDPGVGSDGGGSETPPADPVLGDDTGDRTSDTHQPKHPRHTPRPGPAAPRSS